MSVNLQSFISQAEFAVYVLAPPSVTYFVPSASDSSYFPDKWNRIMQTAHFQMIWMNSFRLKSVWRLEWRLTRGSSRRSLGVPVWSRWSADGHQHIRLDVTVFELSKLLTFPLGRESSLFKTGVWLAPLSAVWKCGRLLLTRVAVCWRGHTGPDFSEAVFNCNCANGKKKNPVRFVF